MSSTLRAGCKASSVGIVGRTLHLEGGFASWSVVMSPAFSCSCSTIPWCCVWWHPAVLCPSCMPRESGRSTTLQPQHTTGDSPQHPSWCEHHTLQASHWQQTPTLPAPAQQLQVTCILQCWSLFALDCGALDLGGPMNFSIIQSTTNTLLR